MAVPTRYNPKKLSDYSVRGGSGGHTRSFSGINASGPGHSNRGMTREDFGRTQKQKDTDAKILASYEKSQKRHEGVMARIQKADTDRFGKVNDALNASKESDPKDALGNTVPSKQTQSLEQELMGIMGAKGRRAAQTESPAAAGIRPEQLIPGSNRLRPKRTDTDVTAEEERGGGLPSVPVAGKVDVDERVEVVGPEGETTQVTVMSPPDANGMVKVQMQDGSIGAVSEEELNRIDLEEKEKPMDLMEYFRQNMKKVSEEHDRRTFQGDLPPRR